MRLLFLGLSSVIVVVSSEKFYWYPQGFSAVGFLELVGFYAFPLAATFWVVERYNVASTSSLLLASGVFALGVEGIVTPVLYEDGALPALALYFFAWHGLASVGFCWYLARKWALANRRGLLGLGSTLYGAAWGLWSTTYWRSESIAEFEAENASSDTDWDPGQWVIAKFALYAVTFTIVLIVAHWLLSFVWPQEWTTTQRWNILTGLVLALGLAMITIAIPWAPIKLGLLVWGLHRLLSRARTQPGDTGLFAELSGPVTLRQLAPLGLLSATAIVTYAAMVTVKPTDDLLNSLYASTVAVQIIAGFATLTAAARRTKVGVRRGGSD